MGDTRDLRRYREIHVRSRKIKEKYIDPGKIK
jgi:hypothetical protein